MLSLWDTHHYSYSLLRYSLSATFTFYSVKVCFLVFPEMHSFPLLWLYSLNKQWVSAHCAGSAGKEFACNVGDLGSTCGLERSLRKGNGNPLQYSWLENPVDRGAWLATVHGVASVGQDWATKPPPPALSAQLCCEPKTMVKINYI